MAKEGYIYGKSDNGDHVGRYSNVKAEQEAQQALNDFFLDMYGIPFAWAKGLALLNLGDWQVKLDSFEELIKKPVDEGEVDIT